MRVIQFNTTCGVGSTGKIAVSISELLTKQGIENYILYSSSTNGFSTGISCCSPSYTKIQALKSRILGNYGFNSQFETKRMIAEIERINPEVVLLHNIHGHDCNLSLLFTYLKQKHIKLFWTFHDCWAFTAYCTHFTFDKCKLWKNGCHNCPQRKQVSWFFDRSSELYRKKKKLFSGLNLEIVTPSQWLADLVKQSFLKDYSVKVIHNGIDLSIFKPTPSDFRKKHGISPGQKLLLGVAFGWGKRKGLDVFIELAHRLDSSYQIVLVGTDDATDRILPKNIISVHRTQNQQELAEIYTAADVFVNPTREDNFPTVNLEALACGTPVITFNTGGSPECIDDTCGCVVPVDDIDALGEEIEKITKSPHESYRMNCMKKAMQFDKDSKFKEYIQLLSTT